MIVAGFTDVGATLGIFGCVEVAEVLVLVVFLHMLKDWDTLPMCRFKVAVLGALFANLYFAACLPNLGVNFLLAFRTNAFRFAHSNQPTTASTMSARGSSIIDMVTKRSYLRIFATVEAEMNRRREE